MGEDATEDERTGAVGVLIRRCAYREALETAGEQLGGELGQFCMALLGEQRTAMATLEQLLTEFYDAMPMLEDRPLRPFLYGRALSLCDARLAAQGEDERRAVLSLTPPDARRLPGAAAETQRDARQLRLALASLKPPERHAALLRYAAHLDYASIGELCATDATTVKKRVGKALLGVRQALQEGDA